jgi:twitching motility protein PilT
MTVQTELNNKTTNTIITPTANNFLKRVVASIPPTYHGPERVTYLIELLPTISYDEKELLIITFNNLLKVMIDREASDIELGGFGTNGFVWYRIYGNKEPLPELSKFSHDESALLILSILNEKQRRSLEENRNLDFSYTFDYIGNRYTRDNDNVSEIRFRGDAYFDVDSLALNMRSIIPQLRKLDEYDFHSNALKALSHSYIKQGLVLITGITGSGKSTTLDAIVDWHNSNLKRCYSGIKARFRYNDNW